METAIYGFFVLIIGISIGSFLNVCIYRIPKGESIIYPPSHCPSCDNKIESKYLIPVISYILIKGRCAYCKSKISIRYPLVELFTGIIYLSLYLKYGFTLEFYKYCFLITILIVASLIDHDCGQVFFNISLVGILGGIVFIVAGFFIKNQLLTYILGGLLGTVFLSLIVILTGGMGWGDVEICLIIGLFLGLSNTILMLFLSFIIGTLYYIPIIMKNKNWRKKAVPFVPFLSAASVIAVFFGEAIIKWYILLL